MHQQDITLAILTWKAPKTLLASLESISDLLPFFREKLLVCQESDPREIEIGQSFGFDIISLDTNVGIQNGIKTCFENSNEEIVLFYENDLNLRSTVEEAKLVLLEAISAIEKDEAKFVKLRYQYGNNSLKSKAFDRYWVVKNSKLNKKLISYFRQDKAAAVLSTSLPYLHSLGVTPPGYIKFSDNFLLGSTVNNK